MRQCGPQTEDQIMADEYITGGEFGRFRADHTQWRIEIAKQISDGFSGINKRLDDMNGRGRETAARVEIVEADVERLMQHGCAQYDHHRDTLEQLVVPKLNHVEQRVRPWDDWHPAAKVAGGVGGFAVLATFLELVRQVLQHFGI